MRWWSIAHPPHRPPPHPDPRPPACRRQPPHPPHRRCLPTTRRSDRDRVPPTAAPVVTVSHLKVSQVTRGSQVARMQPRRTQVMRDSRAWRHASIRPRAFGRARLRWRRLRRARRPVAAPCVKGNRGNSNQTSRRCLSCGNQSPPASCRLPSHQRARMRQRTRTARRVARRAARLPSNVSTALTSVGRASFISSGRLRRTPPHATTSPQESPSDRSAGLRPASACC